MPKQRFKTKLISCFEQSYTIDIQTCENDRQSDIGQAKNFKSFFNNQNWKTVFAAVDKTLIIDLLTLSPSPQYVYFDHTQKKF